MLSYYTFEVEMRDLEPRVWRQFRIRTTATFAQLHEAIQESFGWQDSHLWEFRQSTQERVPIAGLVVEDDFGEPPPDARKVKLSSYFAGEQETQQCEYLYDFGDDWLHDVKLVDVQSDSGDIVRELLGGAQACPPEDCGGLPGYERFVEFVATGEDPFGEDPKELAHWLGDWQPNAFDLQAAKDAFDR